MEAISYKGKTCTEFFVAHVDPEYATLQLPIRVTFQNIDFQPYALKIVVQPKDLKASQENHPGLGLAPVVANVYSLKQANVDDREDECGLVLA